MNSSAKIPQASEINVLLDREGSERPRLLAICNIDTMAWVILRQWLIGLQSSGYEVHIACAKGDYFTRLEQDGFRMHAVSIKRTFRPWHHIRPVIELKELIRNNHFDVVNTHSAVAAFSGRIAAWLAGCPATVCTVHGFYFHDQMPVPLLYSLMGIEWLLGKITNFFMFVSDEDRRTAIRTGIVSKDVRSITIFNGVDLDVFHPKELCLESVRLFKRELGISPESIVIGFVGRIVREKGLREFLEMARHVQNRDTTFIIVGDTLPSDRDQFGPVFKQAVAAAGLANRFLFTGHTERVPDYLRVMDIFVLPSYREGFPRSIVEAMATGLPVISTDIRGCREAVVHGITGLIVPPRDGSALALAAERLVTNPEEAARMGRAGRERAIEMYDYRAVQQRFVNFVNMAANFDSLRTRR